MKAAHCRMPASRARVDAEVLRSGRARTRCRRKAVLCQAGEDDKTEFVRSPAQQRIKDADNAVKEAQKAAGMALNSALASSGLGSMLGLKGKASGNTEDPNRGTGQTKEWLQARNVLVEKKLESIPSSEARMILGRENTLLLDVRPRQDYSAYHAIGARNAELYRYGSDDQNLKGLLRRLAFAAQNVRAVERNEAFVEDAKEVLGDAKVVIVACAAGGTMRRTPNFPAGQASRSLLAASQLMEADLGVEIMHLQGGLNAWFKKNEEGEGDGNKYEDNSGKVYEGKEEDIEE